MAYTSNLLQIVLDGTGTEIPALNVTDAYDRYVISGAVTAIGNYAIVPTGTPQLGTTYIFEYEATLDITTYGTTFSIFGVALNQTQLISKLEITCYYNGSAWKVKIVGSLDQSFITSANFSNSSVTTAKLADDSVTNDKLATMSVASVKVGNGVGTPTDLQLTVDETILNTGTSIQAVAKRLVGMDSIFCISASVSFDTDEQATLTYTNPIGDLSGLTTNIFSIDWSVSKELSGTDAGHILIKVNGSTITDGNITIPLASVIGTNGQKSPDQDIVFDDIITIVPSKSTPGGKAEVNIWIRTSNG